MLTVFIPSYNHSRYIVECLESAKKITIENKKIIVVDDASTDDSVKSIEEYLRENDTNDEVLFVKKKINKGVIDSLNLFLSLTSTEYVYLTASDDIVISSGVDKIVKLLECKKSLKFIVGGGVNLLDGGEEYSIYGHDHDEFFNLPPSIRSSEIFLNYPSPILSQSTIIRTTALREIGGWNSEIIADDFAMFTQLLMKFPVRGVDFEFLPKITCVKYRHHQGNSYRKVERQLIMTVQVLKKFAPAKLMNRAIGYKLSYYCLSALRGHNPKIFIKLFLLVPVTTWPWAVIGVLRLMVKRVQ